MPYPDESSAVPVLILVKHPEASSLEYPTKRPGEPMMFGRPNITGSMPSWMWAFESKQPSGAFSKGSIYEQAIEGGTRTNRNLNAFKFDASGSSATYGASATVQPSALRALPCIKS